MNSVEQEKVEEKVEEQLTPEQKCHLLLEFVTETERCPKKDEEYKGITLGRFWDSIK